MRNINRRGHPRKNLGKETKEEPAQSSMEAGERNRTPKKVEKDTKGEISSQEANS